MVEPSKVSMNALMDSMDYDVLHALAALIRRDDPWFRSHTDHELWTEAAAARGVVLCQITVDDGLGRSKRHSATMAFIGKSWTGVSGNKMMREDRIGLASAGYALQVELGTKGKLKELPAVVRQLSKVAASIAADQYLSELTPNATPASFVQALRTPLYFTQDAIGHTARHLGVQMVHVAATVRRMNLTLERVAYVADSVTVQH